MTYVSEVLADAPRAYWRLGDAGSANPPDSSGNGLHITTVENTPAWGAGGAIYGDSDWAYDFDVNDSLQRATNALLEVGSIFTLEAWVKRKTLATFSTIICKFTGSYWLFFWTDDVLYLHKYGTGLLCHSSVAIADSTTWHHIVATCSGTTRKFYIDGADVTVVDDAAEVFVDNADQQRINAASLNTYSGAQLLDEVAIYGTALSAARIQAHYAAGATPQILWPDADTAAGGWTTSPLWSKLNDLNDATLITATAS